jgi:hypothetical protein
MKTIPLIWLIFAVIFACFSGYHFIQLSHSYPSFEWEAYDTHGADVNFQNKDASEAHLNLKKFVQEWNEYIDQQNSSSRCINLVAAIGYLFTSLMAFISMLIPGPYNIKDTAKHIYEKCSNASIYKVCKRKLKKGIKDNDHHEVSETGDSD